MRLLTLVLLLWVSLVSIARADVIFDDRPPPRRYPRPRYPVDLPVAPPVPPPVVIPVLDEDWHPNIEPDPETTPEEAGFAIVLIASTIIALSIREARRSERRTA